MPAKGVFITGFPGFIAGRLMHDLLERQTTKNHYYFLVQQIARVACTLADLAGDAAVRPQHVEVALGFTLAGSGAAAALSA